MDAKTYAEIHNATGWDTHDYEVHQDLAAYDAAHPAPAEPPDQTVQTAA